MSAHDNLESGSADVEVQRLQIMEHINQHRARLGNRCLRQRGCPGFVVGVPPDRHNRGDAAQCIDNLLAADISAVNDQFRAAQRC